MLPLPTIASWVAAGTGFLAAALWWRASAIEIPPFPDVGWDSHSAVFEPVRQAMARSSFWNRIAAAVTGLSVFAQAMALALQG